MQKSTKNKLAMYKAVKSVIAANSDAWVGFPAFVTAYELYVSKVDTLEQSGYNQALATIGVRPLKDAKRELVAEKFYATASAILAYAVASNKVDLIHQMDISKWDILKGASVDALQKIDIILAKAIEHLGDLGDFGIDQAVVDELQILRDEMDILFNSPRSAIVSRKTFTGSLPVIRKDVDAILNLRLDKLMEVLKAEHPEFYAAYRNARVVVDLKGRKAGDKDEAGSDEQPEDPETQNEEGDGTEF